MEGNQHSLEYAHHDSQDRNIVGNDLDRARLLVKQWRGSVNFFSPPPPLLPLSSLVTVEYEYEPRREQSQGGSNPAVLESGFRTWDRWVARGGD